VVAPAAVIAIWVKGVEVVLRSTLNTAVPPELSTQSRVSCNGTLDSSDEGETDKDGDNQQNSRLPGELTPRHVASQTRGRPVLPAKPGRLHPSTLPLTDDERAAVDDGAEAVDRLLARLADIPTPSGALPRETCRGGVPRPVEKRDGAIFRSPHRSTSTD